MGDKMKKAKFIDCPSCGDKTEEGSSCESCAVWREENDSKIEMLEARVKELEDQKSKMLTAHAKVLEMHIVSDKALHDRVRELEAELREFKSCPNESWECAKEQRRLEAENARLSDRVKELEAEIEWRDRSLELWQKDALVFELRIKGKKDENSLLRKVVDAARECYPALLEIDANGVTTNLGVALRKLDGEKKCDTCNKPLNKDGECFGIGCVRSR